MHELKEHLRSHRERLYPLLHALCGRRQPVLLRHEVQDDVRRWEEGEEGEALAGTPLTRWLHGIQEAVVAPSVVNLAVRRRVADWLYVQIHVEEMQARELSISEYLAIKEDVVREGERVETPPLEIDLTPFERGFPKLSRPGSIGRGVQFLNRYLSSRIFGPDGADGAQRLLDFLRVHEVRGHSLMLSEGIEDVAALRAALRDGIRTVQEDDENGDARARTWSLRKLGFEPGWGATPERIRENMELLSDILEAASPGDLERFLGRIPMIFSIVVVSPHGYFGQANVLGKPDTGGQVVYVLDQVRALERAMRASIDEQGLDIEPQIVVLTRLIPEAEGTTCDVRLEPILGTENSRILRVPFRDENGEVVPEWTSRFDIWPYLERFAVEAEREVLAELGAEPDIIIGNYSDGNLVASLMAHRLGVTQCNIAHALEKTKYELSDLHWRQHEEEHHFSCQFTADLIAMNTADFIITSTYQEIAGTADGVGQYESYGSFTMPGLYRVVSGIDCFDPKFNIVSPGADPEVFFPYAQRQRRMHELTEEIRELVYGSPDAAYRGAFAEPDRPILFAMSRLDRIKNMPGLLQWYGVADELRSEANLLLVGGTLDPADSDDEDERNQIRYMHDLIGRHDLESCVRWVELQTNKNRVGELYRVVADSRGAFVQPALFEAFGLTVIEAMGSGLPVFATCFGGPLETIEEGVSGFHIDPTRGWEAAEKMLTFLRASEADPEEWTRISEGAIQRVAERYNWPLYASKLLQLSRIYGFWKFITNIEREETRRYLEMFYALMYRPLAQAVTPRSVPGE
ncbi:MAG TPA: sucrose synthase [Longimicrobiales bacterium]|nr:sucrose synthase [Longimicrobiales bacterium]